jgi:hypothetical protein
MMKLRPLVVAIAAVMWLALAAGICYALGIW